MSTSEEQPTRPILQLFTPRTCRRRYGRATLTIRTSGTIGDLVDAQELATTLRSYRSGAATAEDVAWAFVRSRIVEHSPSFGWEEADLARLIALVVECSEEPLLTSTEPEPLAAELVAADETEREALRQATARLSEQLQGSIGSLRSLTGSPITSLFSDWLGAESRAIESISKALTASVPTQQWRLATEGLPSLLPSQAFLDLTSSYRFPPLGPGTHIGVTGGLGSTGVAVLVSPKVPLMTSTLRFPDNPYRDLLAGFDKLIGTYAATTPLPPIFGQLAAKQDFQVDEIFTAAREAVAFVESEARSKRRRRLRR